MAEQRDFIRIQTRRCGRGTCRVLSAVLFSGLDNHGNHSKLGDLFLLRTTVMVKVFASRLVAVFSSGMTSHDGCGHDVGEFVDDGAIGADNSGVYDNIDDDDSGMRERELNEDVLLEWYYSFHRRYPGPLERFSVFEKSLFNDVDYRYHRHYSTIGKC
nr:expressed protein [Hymenolepis microstoma]